MDSKDVIPSEAEENIASANDLKSKKFIAYIISLIIAIGGFIFVYLTSKDSTNFYKFLDFLLYSFVAYIGGNSVEHIAKNIGGQNVKN